MCLCGQHKGPPTSLLPPSTALPFASGLLGNIVHFQPCGSEHSPTPPRDPQHSAVHSSPGGPPSTELIPHLHPPSNQPTTPAETIDKCKQRRNGCGPLPHPPSPAIVHHCQHVTHVTVTTPFRLPTPVPQPLTRALHRPPCSLCLSPTGSNQPPSYQINKAHIYVE